MTQSALPSTPVTKVQTAHVSVRQFTNQHVSDDIVKAILTAARRSPTSSNAQTYSVIVVRDPEKKKKLSVLAGNQQHIVDCSVFFLFCADISRLKIACEINGETRANGLELALVSSVDAALVGMSAQTAVESFGLGAVMVGGMRNHPAEAAELLGLPEGCYVVYGMSVGYPDPERYPPQKPRLPEELVIHHEQYSSADPTPLIKAHDADLAKHYESLGRNQHTAAWSGPIARRLRNQPRPTLRATLERLGFSFD